MRRIRPKLFSFMCRIIFSQDSEHFVCVVNDLKLEDAVQFALNLHRSSNTKHDISVVDKDDNIILMLSLD